VRPPLVVPVADLLGRPGARRAVAIEAPLTGLVVTASRVDPQRPVNIDVVLEWVSDGILASGCVLATWVGDCRRCLRPAQGLLEAKVRELFERQPRDGESYRLSSDSIDLAPMTRDALLLDLPLAPLCSPSCAGLCVSCGANLNDGPCPCPTAAGDPRWAALDGLHRNTLHEN